MNNKWPKILKRVSCLQSKCRFKSEQAFDKFSYEDWSPTGPMAALHSLNKLRVPWIAHELNSSTRSVSGNQLEGLKILDVGCGAGILSIALCALGADVLGIDSSESSINCAMSQAQSICPEKLNKTLNFQVTTPDELEFNTNSNFDGVVASEIKGTIFFTTINRTLLSFVLAKVAAEYILRVVPRGVHDWNKFVPPKDLETYLLSCNHY
ncbi:hypothetical protein MXB_1326 [Myxobolus squamalis]|nr:hypothetical protein MXB_1326 [Myxobolus squamalis]